MAKKSDKGLGYGRPPQHSRFKPGQSGNPRGRPKGSLNFTTDLKNTLLAPVALNDGGKSRRVTTQKGGLASPQGKSPERRRQGARKIALLRDGHEQQRRGGHHEEPVDGR
ncbi:DUF5681 domain-containing protein [Bradyrhizobium sp. LLZ17]|uniref:DUF5681 domain-containing protein n=1 Tax=Bradyrhizobium sp. LLZ17 TaxID=3239388 RepID=A0AB39XKI7_9BRAD